MFRKMIEAIFGGIPTPAEYDAQQRCRCGNCYTCEARLEMEAAEAAMQDWGW